MKTIRNSSMSFTFAGLELHDQLEGQWPLAFLARASRYEKPALGALSWPENWPKRLKTRPIRAQNHGNTSKHGWPRRRESLDHRAMREGIRLLAFHELSVELEALPQAVSHLSSMKNVRSSSKFLLKTPLSDDIYLWSLFNTYFCREIPYSSPKLNWVSNGF